MFDTENAPDTTVPTGTVAGVRAVGQLAATHPPEDLKRVLRFLGPTPASAPPPVVPEDLLDLGLEHPEKRAQVGNFMLWLIHKNQCLGRPEYQAAFPNGCSFSFCVNMNELVKHWKQCTAGDQCVVTNCTLAKRIFSHCEVCTTDRCSVCNLCNYRLYHPNKRAAGSTLTIPGVTGATTDAIKTTLMPMASRRHQPAVLASGCAVDKTDGCCFQAKQSYKGRCALAGVFSTGSESSVEGVKAAVPGVMPMRQRHTGPPPVVVKYFMDDIEVFRASHDLFGSLQAASSPIGPLLMPPQRWHAEMAISDFASAISLRNDKIRKIVDRISPNNGPSDMADPRITPRIAYAQNVEAKLYQQSTSEGEYDRDMAAKIGTSPKELEENIKGVDDSDWRLERQTAVALRVNGNHNHGFQSGNDVCIPMDNPSKMACAGKACICGPQLQTDHGSVPMAFKVFVCVVVFLLIVSVVSNCILVIPTLR